jgi:hypothetical protein
MATLLSPVAAIADPATTAKEPGGGEVLRRSAATQPSAAEAATVPTGFRDQVVWTGLTLPTAVVFAPSRRVFIAEKSGLIKTFDNTGDITPTTAVDLRTVVDDYWDRGMLGMALDPQLGTAGHNYLYVLYTYDAAPGQTPPQWNDACPGPPDGPGPTTDGCVVQGRLSRIPVDPATGVANGPEQVLIGPDWCQQYPSHSIGHLAFGPDGALYASAGDGASFEFVDYGQAGGTVINPNTGQPYTQANPCNDPPGSLGVPNTSPNGRGGALRSPSLRRPANDRFCSTARSCGWTRPPATACPTIRWPPAPVPTPAGSWRRGCATPSTSPSGPAPTRCGSATSAGTPGRRSSGSRHPPHG